jgi:uncharacterized protein YneF (UPF0154 family)
MRNTITIIMIILSLLMMLVGMSACYTEQKAMKQVDKAQRLFPAVPAKHCYEKYPPLDSVSIVKEFIPGQDVVINDTVWETEVSFDTVLLTRYITKAVKSTDTFRDTRYVQVENKVGHVLRDARIAELSKENAVLQSQKASLNRRVWILGCLLGLFVAYKVVRLYLGRKMIFV